MRATVAALQQEGFAISSVDVQTAPQLADQYRVQRVPTCVYVRDRKEVRRVTGTQSQDDLRQLFR